MAAPQYITDEKGKKVSVVLPIKEYKKILEELEDLEDIRSYDRMMESKAEYIPLNKALKQIEVAQKKKK